jgi:hypothetical protein
MGPNTGLRVEIDAHTRSVEAFGKAGSTRTGKRWVYRGERVRLRRLIYP